MNNPNINTIEWVFDFLSVDLSSFDELRMEELEAQAEYYFVNQWRYFPLRGASVPDETIEMYRRRGIGRTRSDLQWPLEYPWLSVLKNIQEALSNVLQRITSLSPESEVWDIKPRGIIPHRVWDIDRVTLAFDISPESFSVGYKIIDHVDESTLHEPDFLMKRAIITLYLVLDGLPNGSIKTCIECGKYFLHLIKKPKMFCSQRCASKASSRAHREKIARVKK